MEASTNDVQVVINEPRKNAPTLQIHHTSRRARERQDFAILADRGEDALLDRDGTGGRPGAIKRCNVPAMQYKIGCGVRIPHW